MDNFKKEQHPLNDAQETWVRTIRSHAQAIVNETATAFQCGSEEAKMKLINGTEILELAVMWLVKGLRAPRTYDLENIEEGAVDE